MAFIAVPDGVLAELVMLWDDQIVENTLGWSATSTPSADDLLTLCGELATWWDTQLGPNLSDSVSLIAVKARSLDSETATGVEYTTGLPVTGGNTSPSMPNNVALCVSLRTGRVGRSYRGRNYVPGACENQVTQNAFLEAFTSNVVDAYNSLVGAGTFATGFQFAVISRFSGGAPRSPGITIPITNAIVVDNVVDSQRRRLPGRGR